MRTGLSEAAAIESELVDMLRGRLENGNSHRGRVEPSS
jgi:hypothetical protein